METDEMSGCLCKIFVTATHTSKMSIETTDVIEKTIGRFGKYQAFTLFLILLGRIQVGFQLYSYVFIIPKVVYTCMDENAPNITNYCPCENPNYDQSEIVTSVTSEWNLICERTIFASLFQSAIQLGILPGSILSGWLSDRYGRKLVFCLAFFSSSIFVLLSSAVQQLWLSAVIRFLTGFSAGGAIMSSYVFTMELVGNSFRSCTGAIYLASNIFSYLTISLLAYFVREWRYIQILTSAPWILTISYFWILPESPRWLITVGRKEEAIALLVKIATRNGLRTDNIEAIINESEASINKVDPQQERGSFADLFKSSKLGIYSITVAILWMICGYVYYGINMFIGQLQGNIYLNTVLSASFLMLAVVTFLLCTRYLKRRAGLALGFVLAVVFLFVYLLTPNNVTFFNLPFIIMGSVAFSTSYSQLYLYSSEIFPTVVRNSALGFASTTGKAGGIVVPFIINAVSDSVAILIFIFLLLVALMLVAILPETKDIVLMNTIQETEYFAHKETKSSK